MIRSLPIKRKLKDNEYRCANCGGVFNKGWSDAEAIEELMQRQPNVSAEECDLVCDPCFRHMMRWLRDIGELP